MERRTACHFSETNVQKRIETKTIPSSSSPGHFSVRCVPKKQIKLKLSWCAILLLCHIKEGNDNNMQENQSDHVFSVPPPSTLTLFFMVQPSYWVHVSWQRLTDSGPKEEKRGEWIVAVELSLFSPVVFVLGVNGSLCSPNFADHREEAQRSHQPQPVRAPETGAQCFWETGSCSRIQKQIKMGYKWPNWAKKKKSFTQSDAADVRCPFRVHLSWRKRRFCRWQWTTSNCCMPWEEKVSSTDAEEMLLKRYF